MRSLIYLSSDGMDVRKPGPYFAQRTQDGFIRNSIEQGVVKYMVTLFEENIKTVACTTWNECKLKSGVQTPAAEEMQGRIHRSGVKKQRTEK